MPEANKKALERWLERPDSIQTRDMAAARGTATHNSAEYILKTAHKLTRATATKRRIWKPREDGLSRAPKAINPHGPWRRLFKGLLGLPWCASGYARGLRGWILDHITAIHAVEFSGYHPAGFAGACDCLADVDEVGPMIIDWKTTGKSIHSNMESALHNYRDQLGAYSLMLKHRTGIQAQGGMVVIARRSGAPTTESLDLEQLLEAEERFTERVIQYYFEL